MASDGVEALIGERILRSFVGNEPTADILAAIAAGRTPGVTLYRAKNIHSPSQVRALTDALQSARPGGSPPLLIGLDQEGGQLQAVGDGATAWPGNLALAAAGSVRLARRAGVAVGRELAAMGVNVDFAPVCDLLTDPRSPVMGTRTFGDEPDLAGRLAAATVRGLQSAGVAATLKHFPGHGAVAGDSHHGLPIVPLDMATIRRRELAPFAAGIRGGARLVMLGHLAVPAATDGRAVPATLAPELARTLLRDELRFEGVSISDALDMGAMGPLEELPGVALGAVRAGIDLLLTVHEPALVEGAMELLSAAARDGRLGMADLRSSAGRIRALRRWLGARDERPPLSVVGCPGHVALAREIAENSITLVRDRAGLVPLRLAAGARVAVLLPRPVDLSPADTSSYVRPRLGAALSEAGLHIDEIELPGDATGADVDGLRARLAGFERVIVGTIDALSQPGQARIVRALVVDRLPVIAVALRTPADIAAYPDVGTYACTYGIQAPNLEALADGLLGRIPFAGRLPVRLDPALVRDAA